MTKTKKQLRAEAVERLKNCVAARFDAESIVIALTSGRHGQSDWSLECDKLIYLLTDDANDDSAPENDVSADDVDANDANATHDDFYFRMADVLAKSDHEFKMREISADEARKITGWDEVLEAKQQDSREKLEADVITTFGDGLVRSIIMRLLDRQVAITCTEQREWWGDVVAELQDRVDTLTRYIHDIKQIARKV